MRGMTMSRFNIMSAPDGVYFASFDAWHQVESWYQVNKERIADPEYRIHGAVLMEYKNKCTGFELNLTFDPQLFWETRPTFLDFRSAWAWIGFCLGFRWVYHQVQDKQIDWKELENGEI